MFLKLSKYVWDQRSKNDLDLLYSQIFKNSLRGQHIPNLAQNLLVSKKAYDLAIFYKSTRKQI